MLKSNRLLSKVCVAVICCVFISSFAFSADAAERQITPRKTSTSVQPAASPEIAVQQKPASLKIESLAISPVSGGGAVAVVQPGSIVTLGFVIKNVGLGAVPPGTTYALNCTVLSGSNACPLASSSGAIPELAPGASKSYTFIGVEGALPGTYRLTVTTSLDSRGRAPYVDFTVPVP